MQRRKRARRSRCAVRLNSRKRQRTVTSDGLALDEGEAVSALETGNLAVREDSPVLRGLGLALHGVGLDDLELETVVSGSTESLM